ncbi:MAG: hypothetical protein N3F66_12805 [Spirochaetes bacterium]|nr:hypothetical protein [Spirochaetota bacterium]
MNYKIKYLISEIPILGAMVLIFLIYTLLVKNIGIFHFVILTVFVYYGYYKYKRFKKLWAYVESIREEISYNNRMTVYLNSLKYAALKTGDESK